MSRSARISLRLSLCSPRTLTLENHVLIAIRIEESAWNSATPERRREWTRLVNELLEQQPADDQQEIQLVVSPPLAGSFQIEIETPEGYPLREIVLPLKTILPHIEEYADICDQLAGLAEGSTSARLEALDMGKRVVHDRAAKTLLENCGSMLSGETMARNFFSLLISLYLDTTKMLSSTPVWMGG